MGKVTGFLEIQREQPARRKVDERLQDWFEIYEPFPEEKQREQGARCMDCGVPFCHTGCPVNNLIPDWNDLVYNGRWEAAIRRLHATNNFPEFTGRICPAPCEAACVLGINQPAVSIKLIERSIVERAWEEGWIHPEPPEQNTGKRVAVVGSGPAGLAAAQQLRRAGHSVTVYEKNDRIGGLMRYGIPNFKLEKHVIDRRIQQMRAEGVTFVTNAHVGVNVPVEALTGHYDAILLAGGSEQPRDLKIPGRELQGIHFAMEFLPQQNRRCEGDVVDPSIAIHAEGKRVVIIGGGDTGADCLGTSLRQHAKSVHQFEIMPKPPASAPPPLPGRCGPCSCAPRPRTKRAASATGASTASTSPATRTATSAAACRPRWSAAEVRAHSRLRVHARRRSGSAGHGLPGPGALRHDRAMGWNSTTAAMWPPTAVT
jgi:glutamate synthase (NADPH/NADH) small chain